MRRRNGVLRRTSKQFFSEPRRVKIENQKLQVRLSSEDLKMRLKNLKESTFNFKEHNLNIRAQFFKSPKQNLPEIERPKFTFSLNTSLKSKNTQKFLSP